MRIRTLTMAMGLLAASPAAAQTNAGGAPAIPQASAPFDATTIATLPRPWRIAFLPDARLLVTAKPGGLWIVTQKGGKTEVTGTPSVLYRGQSGMLGVYVSPQYARDRSIYLTYSEPGEGAGVGGLAVMRARIVESGGTARLDGAEVIWRDLPRGTGGQYGGAIAFAPDGKSMFLTLGDRQRFWPAQDPNVAVGKVLHLTLDGKPAPGNPGAGKTGPQTITHYESTNTRPTPEAAVKREVTLDRPNLAPAEIWASGIRTPYGLAFNKQGQLWELEHGPKGGDELNLIEKGKNYGWPFVSYGINYDGSPIPSHDTRPEFTKPKLYWVPIIAPGGFTFYYGKMFPKWQGSALIAAMAAKSLIRVSFDARGNPHQEERWDLGERIRDVAVAPDGAVWVIEDIETGALKRLTPKK